MTIQFADITVIHNIEEDGILRTFGRLINYENCATDLDTIIITFDDEPDRIYDVKTDYIEKNYEFGPQRTNYFVPAYFTNRNKNLSTCFHRKSPHIYNWKPCNIWYRNVFDICKNFDFNDAVSSYFNIVYVELYKENISFGILKIKSPQTKPRFKLAYDDTIFDKSDIIYLVDYFLKYKFE